MFPGNLRGRDLDRLLGRFAPFGLSPEPEAGAPSGSDFPCHARLGHFDTMCGPKQPEH